MPDDVAAKMDWRAGEDKGRIWRIVPEKVSDVKPFVSPTTTEDLVKMLGDGNGWRRMLAQRLLVEGKRVDAEKSLRSAVRNSQFPVGGGLFFRTPINANDEQNRIVLFVAAIDRRHHATGRHRKALLIHRTGAA